MYRDTTNVEHDMYDYTGNNCSHRHSNKRFKKNFEVIPGKRSIDSVQKTVVLGTANVIRKVLQCET